MPSRRRFAALAAGIILASLPAACTTFGQGIGVDAEEGRAVRIEAVTLDADGALVTLAFVGAAEFEARNPCTSGYRGEAWTSGDGTRLLVRAFEWNPVGHRDANAPCELIGHSRHVTVGVDPPFLGTEIQDVESLALFPVTPGREDGSR